MGRRRPILNGTRFGSLVVVGVGEDYIQPSNGSHHSTSICVCDCGNTKTVPNRDLRKGGILSCGCMRIERLRQAAIKHGEKYTRLYQIWNTMKGRCNCPTNHAYEYYGGRGIRICEEWSDYENFSNWAKSSGYADNLTIERIDVNGNYCPENCKWATVQEQNDNKTNSCRLTYDGETHTLKEWSKITGISYDTLSRRYNILGWSIENVLTKPVDKSKRNHRWDNKEKKDE